MKTVKQLIKELNEFPQNAKTYAYEGESVGIVIKTNDGKFGFIYNGERGKDAKTETLR
jgi:hypothetical protein